MKTLTHNLIAIMTLLFAFGTSAAYSQSVTPTTPDVVLLCADAGNYDLGAAPATGTNPRWVVRYYDTPLADITQIGMTAPITLSGNAIPAANLITGYLYISTISDETCESEPTIVPIYKFAPIAASISGVSDYCEESIPVFTATATSTDSYTTYAYQWYTTDGTTDSPIAGATDKIYTPERLLAGNTTSYKVRIGYEVNTAKYCSNLSAAKEVSVTAKPTKPTITIEGITGEGW